MHSVKQNPSEPRALDFEGTPAEMADMFDEFSVDPRGDQNIIEVLGLTVEHVHRGAQHNGFPAFGFSLGDRDGSRNVGRLTLLDADTWYGEIPTWTVYYDDIETAKENLRILEVKRTRPKYASVTLDLAYEEDSLEEALANISAAWGISCEVIDRSGPGGGWPVIKYSGFTDRIEKMMRGDNDEYGYGMGDEEVNDFLLQHL